MNCTNYMKFLIVGLVPISLMAQVLNTKHDLSVSSTGATIKASTTTQVCVFCHTPHKSSAVSQVWNHEPTTETGYLLYSSPRLASYPSPSQPNDKSKLCMSCHDGTIAVGSVYVDPSTGGPGTISMVGVDAGGTIPTSSPGHIGTDLTDDHPIGFTYDPSSDPDLITRAWPWNSAVVLDPDAANGTVECHTCHDVHDNTFPPFLHLAKADLCNECHAKAGWAESDHSALVNCDGCHIPHGGSNSLLTEIEENSCYQAGGCHGQTSPGTGSTGRVLDIETQMGAANYHPTNTISGVHGTGESGPSDYAAGNRHAECFDCHDPHVAGGSTTGIASALLGTWGVKPTYAEITESNRGHATNNDNVWVGPTGYTVINPATDEYQLCLKCHSDYTTQPAGRRNIAEEINPFYSSTHGLFPRGDVGSGTPEPANIYVNSNSMNEPWISDPSRQLLCSDCHAADIGFNTIDGRTDAKGPHGSNVSVGSPDASSNQTAMLIATIASDDQTGTPLCNVCHSSNNYWDGGSINSSAFDEHPSDRKDHRLPYGCFSCHMRDYSYYPADTGGDSRQILVHGMNKRYNINEQPKMGFSAGSGDPVNAFVAGFVANLDVASRDCWSEPAASGCGERHRGENYKSAGP